MKTNEKDKWYELGRLSCIDDLAAELTRRAGVLYSEEKLELAEFAKELGKEYTARWKVLREDYEVTRHEIYSF